MHGDPPELAGLLPDVDAMADDLRAGHALTRLELGTYEREFERYGGAEGYETVEQVFRLDSDTVSRLLLARLPAHRRVGVAGLTARTLANVMGSSWHLERGALTNPPATRYRLQSDEVALSNHVWGVFADHGTSAPNWVSTFSRDLEVLSAAVGLLSSTLEASEEREDVLRSIVHMHCNRLAIGRDGEADVWRAALAYEARGRAVAER
jgi:thiopeptide-type bacteriocin biosynthesis protein